MFSPGFSAGSARGDVRAVEDLREDLLREYGYEVLRDQYALYTRLPAPRVSEVTPELLAQLERRLRREVQGLAQRVTTAFVIADQDYVELDIEQFLAVLREHQPAPIRQAVSDALSGVAEGRDPRLRRILTELSEVRHRELVENVRRGGRSASRLTSGRRGRVVAYRQAPPEGTNDLALLPTIRAAVRRGSRIGPSGRLDIQKQDLQQNIRYTRVGSFMALVADTSSYDEDTQEQTRGLVRSLLLDAYERRDRVGLVLCRGNRAQVASDFTSDVDAVRARFMQSAWGGLTPFTSGVSEGVNLFLARLADTIDVVRLYVLLSDGRANVPLVQGGDIRRELMHLPYLFERTMLTPVVVDVSPRGSPFLREFSRVCKGRYYHPPTQRYHKVALAQELLNSLNSGEKDRANLVGKTFLGRVIRSSGSGSSPSTDGGA